MERLTPAQEDALSLKIKGRMMPFEDFSSRLRNFCGSLGFDEAEIRHLDAFDDARRLSADAFCRNRKGDAVIVLSCRVSYNPNWGGFCGMPQLLVREKYEDSQAHCPASFINPFLEQYRNAREHVHLTETEEGRHLITIPEWFLQEGGESRAGRLIIALDQMAEQDRNGNVAPVLVNGSMFSYPIARSFLCSLADLGHTWRKGKSIPIDCYLTSELFSFENIEAAVDDRSPFRPTLLPHLSRIVTHRTPNLKAAEIHLGCEFARTMSTFTADHPDRCGRVLCLAGLDIEMAVCRGHEEHYFVPWKACLEPASGDSGEECALGQDDLYRKLMQQERQ